MKQTVFVDELSSMRSEEPDMRFDKYSAVFLPPVSDNNNNDGNNGEPPSIINETVNNDDHRGCLMILLIILITAFSVLVIYDITQPEPSSSLSFKTINDNNQTQYLCLNQTRNILELSNTICVFNIVPNKKGSDKTKTFYLHIKHWFIDEELSITDSYPQRLIFYQQQTPLDLTFRLCSFATPHICLAMNNNKVELSLVNHLNFGVLFAI